MGVFAEAIRIRREELGLGQKTLADKIGVTQQAVSRWERALALPRPAKVIALAQTLELDPKRLHRLAGYLPEEEQSPAYGPWQEMFGRVSELTRSELMLLMDMLWEEIRSREGLSPPGTK